MGSSCIGGRTSSRSYLLLIELTVGIILLPPYLVPVLGIGQKSNHSCEVVHDGLPTVTLVAPADRHVSLRTASLLLRKTGQGMTHRLLVCLYA
jgi:hypothetical protein